MKDFNLDGIWYAKDHPIVISINKDEYLYIDLKNKSHGKGTFSTEEDEVKGERLIKFSGEPQNLTLWMLINESCIMIEYPDGERIEFNRY